MLCELCSAPLARQYNAMPYGDDDIEIMWQNEHESNFDCPMNPPTMTGRPYKRENFSTDNRNFDTPLGDEVFGG